MPTQADVEFARVVLKKGWLPKERIEDALREVDKLRAHDPEMTLSHYLGLKEILDWEKIEWARDLLAAGEKHEELELPETPPAAAPHEPGPAGRRAVQRPAHAHGAHGAHAHGAHGPGAHGPGAHAHGAHAHGVHAHGAHAHGAHAHGAHQQHSSPRRKNNTAPLVIGIVVAVAAIVGGAIFILSDSSKKRPAGDQAKDEKTAAAAPTLTAAPQAADAAKGVTPGADVNAQRQWQTLRLDIANQSENDGYQALVARIEEHVRQFPGATTAKEAQEALKGLQAKWKTAADEALAAIDVFLSGREFGKALSDAQALLAWCPKTMQEEIQAKIKEIELKRSTEVAQVPKKSEEETTTPPNEGSGDDDTTTKTPADDEDPEELTASDDAKGKKTGESDEDPEELTPDTTTTKKKDDKGDDLFKKKGTVGPKQDLLAKLIKKEGLEKVQKEVERLFECTKVVVSEDGRVRVGYAFSTREDRLARDWTPAIGKKQSQRIRWSADWEGTIRWVFYGVRISEYGALLNDACFTEQVEVEACYMSAQATSKRTTIVVGVLDKKDNIWLGSNMGAQAIQGDNAGKVTRGNPSVPREFPEVEKTRWFKMVYADKKVTSYLALGGGARDPVTFEVEPTYRKTGEIEVKKGGTKMCPGIAFYPDIVGTIGFVRFSGYLNPEWLREQAKKRGCNLDFDAVGVGDI